MPPNIRGVSNFNNCIYSLWSDKFTNPNPLDFPLEESLIILLDKIDKYFFLKKLVNSNSSIDISKLPTYIV